jgi:putative membrane protein
MENYSVWGWLLWYGIFLLFFINMGNFGYTYRAHRRLKDVCGNKDALDILNERYASGDISQTEYSKIKSEICRDKVVEKAILT